MRTNRPRACTWSSDGWIGSIPRSAAGLPAADSTLKFPPNRSVNGPMCRSRLRGSPPFTPTEGRRRDALSDRLPRSHRYARLQRHRRSHRTCTACCTRCSVRLRSFFVTATSWRRRTSFGRISSRPISARIRQKCWQRAIPAHSSWKPAFRTAL